MHGSAWSNSPSGPRALKVDTARCVLFSIPYRLIIRKTEGVGSVPGTIAPLLPPERHILLEDKLYALFSGIIGLVHSK